MSVDELIKELEKVPPDERQMKVAFVNFHDNGHLDPVATGSVEYTVPSQTNPAKSVIGADYAPAKEKMYVLG